MPHVAERVPDLLARLAGAAHLDGDSLAIDDEATFRDATIRDLAWTAAFATDEATVGAAQWLIHEAARELGAHSASIEELYRARARGEVSGFTVPAINIRAPTFDMARTAYEAATAGDVGAVILDSPKRADVHLPAPIDYSTAVQAGARGCRPSSSGRPLPVQREVRQRSGGDDRGDPARLPARDRRRLSDIDIDSSTLVDLSKATRDVRRRQLPSGTG
jgi:hypothetical protein